jgi:hypothetical protein
MPDQNHDIHYAYSPIDGDGAPGRKWYNSPGHEMVLPINVDSDVKVFDIPKGSGKCSTLKVH